MILRLLVPAVDHPGADTPFAWSLVDGPGKPLREGVSALAQAPRAETVEAVLPASRVLFARLKLPKVNAATIRELLPFAVEDRLLADPAQIHAVPGATNAAGETLVAVVDRAWLAEAINALSRGVHGLPDAHLTILPSDGARCKGSRNPMRAPGRPPGNPGGSTFLDSL